jgi:hypothetical protein
MLCASVLNLEVNGLVLLTGETSEEVFDSLSVIRFLLLDVFGVLRISKHLGR